LDDAIQAVSLMLEDGLDIAFAHRSFQEYFVARFIRSAPTKTQEQLIPQVARKGDSESVIQLLYEMDPHAVESYYLLSGIGMLREKCGLKRKVGVTHWLRYLKLVYAFLYVGESGREWRLNVRDRNLFSLLAFAHRNYRKEIDANARASVTAMMPGHPLGISADELARIGDLLAAQDGTIRFSQLTPRMPLVKILAETSGIVGLRFLEDVFEIEELIRKRQRDKEASLARIVGLTASSRDRGKRRDK
jgi:hypothetical protein